VERLGLVTGDPLRLDGAGLAGRALGRLDAAAVGTAPLEHADRGLASLTRRRLVRLTSPADGDEALAAALARCAAAAVSDGEPEPHARRLLARPAAAAGFDGAPAGSAGRRERSSARLGGPHESVRGSSGFPAPRQTVARRLSRAAMRDDHRRRVPLPDVVAPVPAPPPGFEAAADALGLDWLVVCVPGGAEAAETPLVEGAPEVERSLSGPAPAPTSTSPARAVPVPPGHGSVSSAWDEVEREPAQEPRRQPSTIAAVEPRVVQPAGAQGLDALVRAWHGAEESRPESIDLAAAAVASHANGSRAPLRTTTTSRAQPSSRASEREAEMLEFGDALGRVLVAELRRYGIEVDEG
jgi:hypothetical protein